MIRVSLSLAINVLLVSKHDGCRESKLLMESIEKRLTSAGRFLGGSGGISGCGEGASPFCSREEGAVSGSACRSDGPNFTSSPVIIIIRIARILPFRGRRDDPLRCTRCIIGESDFMT